MKTQSTKFWLRSLGVAVLAAGVISGISGCKNNAATTATTADTSGVDPAAANQAPADGTAAGQPTQVLGTSSSYAPQQSSENYQQQAPAPVERRSGSSENYSNSNNGNYDQGYQDGEAAESDQAPPPLPEYQQPPAPDPNDLWTPGYWGYGNGGYYWVPGAWCAAPYYGALWTPPYWGYNGGRYGFHHGYWGPHIGFYGGVDYGFGYVGVGYYGGYWSGNNFFYNSAVNRIGFDHGGGNVTNVYNRTVIVNNVTYGAQPVNRVSYNGGQGGIAAQPRPFEVAAMHEQHVPPMQAQVQLHQQAAQNKQNFYSENHGRPAEAAVARPVPAQAGIAAPRGFVANREVAAGQPTAPVNRPAPAAMEAKPGAAMQPMNRPGQPAAMTRQPAETARPGQPASAMTRQPEPAARPTQPAAMTRQPEPAARPAAAPAMHAAAPAARPVPQPAMRPAPAPAMRPAPAPAARPEPAARPAPAPVEHAAPAPRPAPAPAAHAAPAPAAHPAPAPHAAPAPEEKKH